MTTEKAWLTEPNEKRWKDEATGYECFLMRGPTGSWCGYVGLPEGHPAHGFSSYKNEFDLDEIISGEAIAKAKIQKQINDITVHGGITYSGTDEMRGKHLYWFGFDCAHAGDYSPKYDFEPGTPLSLGQPTGWGGVIEYRDMAYAESECVKLAKQLSEIKLCSI